jgi:hypothetical protein
MKILFRKDQDNYDELPVAQQYSDVITQRVECCNGDTIVGRYSVLPFYRELEKDIEFFGGKLINSYSQHSWIANFNYYDELYNLTFPTWNDYDFHLAPEGAYILKGKTNSKKNQWSTHMFAATKREAIDVASRLINDEFIGPQGLLYRKYMPLKTFSHGLNGLPYTDEWRFFFLGTDLLSYGYYWCCEENADERTIEPEGIVFARTVAAVASKYVNFFVVDVGKTESGDWIMIELNDGQMSGLSMNDPHKLYVNLVKCVS